MIKKKYNSNIYYKLFYKYKNDQVYKMSFLIRYAKTRYIKKDKLFNSFKFSSSVSYLLRDVDEGGKLENVRH